MKDVTQLHPTLQKKIKELKKLCADNGITIRITECLRTVSEQDALYAKGRTKPGSKVTNCQGKSYSSMHQWGVAFDYVIDQDTDKDGDVDINDLYCAKLMNVVGKLGQSVGLEWGGSWKSIVDKPHFQLPDWGSTPAKLKAKYGTPAKFIATWANKTKATKASDNKTKATKASDNKTKTTKTIASKAYNKTFTTTANLKMRTSPDTSDNGNVIQILKKGAKVTGTGKCVTIGTQKWLEVTSGGKTGYCSKKFLK